MNMQLALHTLLLYICCAKENLPAFPTVDEFSFKMKLIGLITHFF